MSTPLQDAALRAESALADLLRLAPLWDDEKRHIRAALGVARSYSGDPSARQGGRC